MEHPEILKENIRYCTIETEAELRESFADFSDNVYNVQPYGNSEIKYKNMILIDVWNAS